MDLHRFIWEMGEAIIRTLADFSIEAQRDEEHVGVWVDENKICAMGVRVRRGITMHGLALNVNTDLSHFSFITPCGIMGRGVTSMAKLLGETLSIEAVKEQFLTHFSGVFSYTMEEGDMMRIEESES